MIAWSEYLFSYLKYLQLTKFISKFRILNQPTIKELAEETETRSCPDELLRLPPLPSNDLRQNPPSCVDEPGAHLLRRELRFHCQD